MENEVFVKEELIKALREFEEKLLDNSKSFYKDLEEMGELMIMIFGNY